MPQKKAKQPDTTFPAQGRAPKRTWKLLLEIQTRLEHDKLTAEDKALLKRMLHSIAFDEDVRSDFWEQVDPRLAETAARNQRIAILYFLYSQSAQRPKLVKQRESKVAEVCGTGVQRVQDAVTTWKQVPWFVAYACMRFENDPRYKKQLLQLGLTDADIETLKTKLQPPEDPSAT